MLAIDLEGPPFERGVQHGEKFAREIREEIRLFCPQHWLDAPEVATLNRRLLSSLADQYPELVIEMSGISAGSGVSFDQITLLNLVLATNDLESDALGATFKLACTAIGIPDGDAGPIAAKNCDERRSAAPFYVFQTVRPDRGLAFMGISNVGTVWLEGGLNEAGLALMQTAGPLAPGQNGYGIACNIAPRPVLARCSTTREAVDMLSAMYVAGWGMGVVLADSAGEVAVVEKSADLCAASSDSTGFSFCTNHFVDPRMQSTIPIAHPGLEENSKARYRTLTTILAQVEWPHTVAGIKEALGYHGDAGFVCQHGDANMYTNYSAIAIPRQKKILLGDGTACQDNYREYTL